MIKYDKQDVLEHIIGKVHDTTKTAQDSAMRARQAAIDAPGRNQSRYDCTKEEQSYLADALNIRGEQLSREALILRRLHLPSNPERVDVGSLIYTADTFGLNYYFILPNSGGETVEMNDGKEVMVMTPESPLAREMIGKRKGDAFLFKGNVYTVLDLK